MLSPPLRSGEVTIDQRTWHFPPVTSSSCAQRNHLLDFSISFKRFFGACKAVSAKVGIADRTQRTRTRRPAIGISLPFQSANLALILSRMNYR